MPRKIHGVSKLILKNANSYPFKTHTVWKMLVFCLAKIELGYRLCSKHSWIQIFIVWKKLFQRNSEFEIWDYRKISSDVKTLVTTWQLIILLNVSAPAWKLLWNRRGHFLLILFVHWNSLWQFLGNRRSYIAFRWRRCKIAYTLCVALYFSQVFSFIQVAKVCSKIWIFSVKLIILRPHITGEENHNLYCIFFPNSAKSPPSFSIDFTYSYLTILVTWLS